MYSARRLTEHGAPANKCRYTVLSTALFALGLVVGIPTRLVAAKSQFFTGRHHSFTSHNAKIIVDILHHNENLSVAQTRQIFLQLTNYKNGIAFDRLLKELVAEGVIKYRNNASSTTPYTIFLVETGVVKKEVESAASVEAAPEPTGKKRDPATKIRQLLETSDFRFILDQLLSHDGNHVQRQDLFKTYMDSTTGYAYKNVNRFNRLMRNLREDGLVHQGLTEASRRMPYYTLSPIGVQLINLVRDLEHEQDASLAKTIEDDHLLPLIREHVERMVQAKRTSAE